MAQSSKHSRLSEKQGILDRVQKFGFQPKRKESMGLSPNAKEKDSTVDVARLDENLRGFAESSRVLMSIPDGVAQIHPFIGVAVLAFQAVIHLEPKRRGKDSKVIALHLRMLDMMSVLVELRSIKNPEHRAQDGRRLRDRMEPLMIRVAKDIEDCGNHCDNYLKKHVGHQIPVDVHWDSPCVVKFRKGPIYESRLATFATVFAERQNEIQSAMIMHTAITLDSAMNTLASIDASMHMLAQFKALETPEMKGLKI